MKDGFIPVACGAPKLRLADCMFNAEQTFSMMRAAERAGVKVLILPELGLTGYSCGDLFCQEPLLRGAEEALCTDPEPGGSDCLRTASADTEQSV